MITIKNITKRYGDFTALKEVSFETLPGEVIGLLGPNGAGKTTLMRIITGFLAPTEGSITIDGIDIGDDIEEIQCKIGYLPENAPLYPDLTVLEHLEFVAELRGITGAAQKHAIREAAAMTGISDRMYFTVSELSKGYKQRLGLAQALIHNPKILILDEPTTGLDPNQILEIRELIKKLGEDKTVILSTHIMQEVEAVCDRVVMINQGKVVAEGTPAELMQSFTNTEFQIKVVVAGSVKAALEAVKKVKSVKKATHIPGAAAGTAILQITAEKDPRAELIKHLGAAKLDLLELSLESQSMEDVFTKLTK
jgi:ABC-2 type transport system ATP-binding protein